jgi:hypothetical protein
MQSSSAIIPSNNSTIFIHSDIHGSTEPRHYLWKNDYNEKKITQLIWIQFVSSHDHF